MVPKYRTAIDADLWASWKRYKRRKSNENQKGNHEEGSEVAKKGVNKADSDI
jgi:hypothetical protein